MAHNSIIQCRQATSISLPTENTPHNLNLAAVICIVEIHGVLNVPERDLRLSALVFRLPHIELPHLAIQV